MIICTGSKLLESVQICFFKIVLLYDSSDKSCFCVDICFD